MFSSIKDSTPALPVATPEQTADLERLSHLHPHHDFTSLAHLDAAILVAQMTYMYMSTYASTVIHWLACRGFGRHLQGALLPTVLGRSC